MRKTRWIPLAAAVLAAVLPSACSREAQPNPRASGSVTVFMWSEYIDPALVEQFEQETGLKVVLDTYENTETMMSKVTSAGGQYDVVVMSDHAVRTLGKKGALQPLDLSKVPNAKNVSARFLHPAYDPEGRFSLPYQWGTMGLVYRTDRLPDFDPSWATILDPQRQPGPVVLLDSMRDLLAASLIFGGCSPNTRSAEELAAAGERLQAARTGRLVGFYGSPDSVDRVLAGEAWVAVAYNGDAMARLDEHTDFALPREGTVIWVDAMTIPAGAPNAAGAHRFIDFILGPEVGARLSNYIAYATPNEASLPLIEPETREDPRIYPGEEEMARMRMLEDVEEATTLYDQVWTRVKAGR